MSIFLSARHAACISHPPVNVSKQKPAPMPVPPELDYDMWQGPAPDAPYTEKRVHTPITPPPTRPRVWKSRTIGMTWWQIP